MGLADIGVLNGGLSSSANGVSADGSVVVGTARDGASGNVNRAFRWTASTGIVNLGLTPFTSAAAAQAVSADGLVVVGSVSGARVRPFRWTSATGVVSLGPLNEGADAFATGVNADGSVVVGSGFDGPGGAVHAFRWTQATGLVSLGTLATSGTGVVSLANGVSGDGLTVVGYSEDAPASGFRAFRWTQTTGMVNLGSLNGGVGAPGRVHSMATGVNADGTVIVGFSADGAALNAERAFRWTQTTGMVSLGVLMGAQESRANAISSNGLVIVGSTNDGPSGTGGLRAFRWTQFTGMQSLERWLSDHGVNVGPTTNIAVANGVNADGSVIVGDLANGHAFIARVSTNGSGMIALNEIAASLSDVRPHDLAADSANMVLHGAHGSPLWGRVPERKTCVWATGDAGRNEYGAADAALGVTELGVCHRFNSRLQIGASLGRTMARQNGALTSRVRHEATFATAESLTQLAGSPIWLTVTGLYHRGEANVRRGYVNAGALDASHADADTRTWAIRSRLDWEDALHAAGAAFSPYLEAAYVNAAVDDYTETGGGFPARFSKRDQSNTQARIGLSGTKLLSSNVRLLGMIEAVHSLKDEAPHTTGEMLGLFAFDLPGARYQRNWVRGGIGIGGKIGNGNASLMLNASTKGEAASYWLAASYRIAF
jgi:probable HAF family extracellular repeat protein